MNTIRRTTSSHPTTDRYSGGIRSWSMARTDSPVASSPGPSPPYHAESITAARRISGPLGSIERPSASATAVATTVRRAAVTYWPTEERANSFIHLTLCYRPSWLISSLLSTMTFALCLRFHLTLQHPHSRHLQQNHKNS